MGFLTNVLDDRTMTSFGVSIATGLALESLFTPTQARYDEDREIPIKVKPTDYKVHAYNIYTILRNIIAATPTKDKVSLYKDSKLKDILTEEVDVIKALYDGINVDLVFYTEEYDKVYKAYNVGKDVNPTRAYEEYNFISNIYKSLDRLPKSSKKTLVFTSYVSDIMDKSSNYVLLESHTGKIKDKSTLNSKYHPIGKRDLSILPVNGLLLYILGDKYIVRPSKLSLRVKLYGIAVDRHWNYRTSLDKIKHDISRDADLLDSIKNYKGIR